MRGMTVCTQVIVFSGGQGRKCGSDRRLSKKLLKFLRRMPFLVCKPEILHMTEISDDSDIEELGGLFPEPEGYYKPPPPQTTVSFTRKNATNP